MLPPGAPRGGEPCSGQRTEDGSRGGLLAGALLLQAHKGVPPETDDLHTELRLLHTLP